ncbi:hypothetical protein [Streptomyces yaizuensis]|uniref:Helix-turn-helix domain-containing protein n=1 Tax=Streptomyces yaizuensis TaxID=2989713 RepID=A0ABQ5NT20_9ACTN|nr:hypothetical protein [Streptomyces sp. YSPA8]GLF93514.1 helix-turn-helix domain-containing protein [Streptomyces sp. YSPA8]
MTDKVHGGQLDEEPNPAQAAFRSALRAVIKASGQAQCRVAQRSGLPETTLSGHLTGHRLPQSPEEPGQVYAAAEEYAARAGRTLPFTAAELKGLWEQARLEQHGLGAAVPRTSAGQPSRAQRSACENSSTRRRRIRQRVRIYARRRTPSRPLATAAVPVPRAEGDRLTAPSAPLPPQSSAVPGKWQAEAAEVGRHLAAGREWDAFMVLRNTGSTVPAHEFPGVVSSCRAAGLPEAAEILLRAAAERETQAVLNIAAAMHDHQQYEDMGLMLAAARST